MVMIAAAIKQRHDGQRCLVSERRSLERGLDRSPACRAGHADLDGGRHRQRHARSEVERARSPPGTGPGDRSQRRQPFGHARHRGERHLDRAIAGAVGADSRSISNPASACLGSVRVCRGGTTLPRDGVHGPRSLRIVEEKTRSYEEPAAAMRGSSQSHRRGAAGRCQGPGTGAPDHRPDLHGLAFLAAGDRCHRALRNRSDHAGLEERSTAIRCSESGWARRRRGASPFQGPITPRSGRPMTLNQSPSIC